MMMWFNAVLLSALVFAGQILRIDAGESGQDSPAVPDPAAELAKKIDDLPPEQRMIAKVITGAFKKPGPPMSGQAEGIKDPTPEEQYQIIGWKKNEPLDAVLRKDGPTYGVVEKLVGHDNAEIARKMWDRTAEYSFSVPISRVWDIVHAQMPFRSRESGRYIATALARLQGFIRDVNAGFDPAEYFRTAVATDPTPVKSHDNRYYAVDKGLYFPVLYGLFLDERDADGRLLAIIRERLREAEDSPAYHIIAGILASHNPDAHRVLVEYMNDETISARRLESILQQIPFWSRVGQLNVSKEMGLFTIYPLGQQMICNWLGVTPYDVNPEMFGRIGEAIGQVLAAEWQRKDGAYGHTNAWFRYLSLWAYGQQAIEDAVLHARNLSQYGDEEQKRVALLFAANLPSIQWRYRVAAPIVLNSAWADNPSLAGLALDCFRMKFQEMRIVPESVGDKYENATILYLTEAERADLYHSLKRMLAQYQPNRIGMPIEWQGGWSMERKPIPVDEVIAQALCKLIARPAPGKIAADREAERQLFVASAMALENPAGQVEEKASNPMAEVIRRWNLPFAIPTAGYGKPDYTLDNMADGQSLPRIADAPPEDESAQANLLRDDFARFLVASGRDYGGTYAEYVLRDRLPEGNFTPPERDVVVSLFRNNPAPALRYAGGLALGDAEYERIESYLINQSSPVQRAIYTKILERDPGGLWMTLSRLIASSDRRLRRAGYELTGILERQDDPEYRETLARATASLQGNAEAAAFFRTFRAGPENGFAGLYNPDLAQDGMPENPDCRKAAEEIKAKIATVTLADIQTIVNGVKDVLVRHAGETYPSSKFPYDKPEATAIGPDKGLKAVLKPDVDPDRARIVAQYPHWRLHLDEFPLAGAWRKYLDTAKPNPVALMMLGYMRGGMNSLAPFSSNVQQALAGRDWFRAFGNLEKEANAAAIGPEANDPPKTVTTPDGRVFPVARPPTPFPVAWDNAAKIAFLLIAELPAAERYPFARRVLEDLMDYAPDEKTSRRGEYGGSLARWRNYAAEATRDDDNLFRDYFAMLYNRMTRDDGGKYPVSLLRAEDLARAWRLGMLNENSLCRILLHGGKQATLWGDLTDGDRQEKFLLPDLENLVRGLAEKIFRLELERGELPTSLSSVAGNFQSLEGGDNLLALADKLDGRDDLEWHPEWKDAGQFPGGVARLSQRNDSVPVNSGRRAMLSYLLRIIRPGPGESAAAALWRLPFGVREVVSAFCPQWRKQLGIFHK